MEMPEGYLEFVETFQNMAIVGYPEQAADLMKEMAEALEEAVRIQIASHGYANGPTEAVLKRFKEWK